MMSVLWCFYSSQNALSLMMGMNDAHSWELLYCFWMVLACVCVCVPMGMTFKLQSQYSESMRVYVFTHHVVVIVGDYRPTSVRQWLPWSPAYKNPNHLLHCICVCFYLKNQWKIIDLTCDAATQRCCFKKTLVEDLETWMPLVSALWLTRLYLTMVMSIAGALVSAFAVPLNPRDPTTVAVKKIPRVEDVGSRVLMHLEDGYIIPF